MTISHLNEDFIIDNKVVKDPFVVRFISNKEALIKMMPLTFEVTMADRVVKGDEARILYDAFMKANPDKRPAMLVIFNPLNDYKVSEYQLTEWDHKRTLKNIKDQEQLNKYLAWVKYNNKMIHEQHSDLLLRKLESMNLLSLPS